MPPSIKIDFYRPEHSLSFQIAHFNPYSNHSQGRIDLNTVNKIQRGYIRVGMYWVAHPLWPFGRRWCTSLLLAMCVLIRYLLYFFEPEYSLSSQSQWSVHQRQESLHEPHTGARIWTGSSSPLIINAFFWHQQFLFPTFISISKYNWHGKCL